MPVSLLSLPHIRLLDPSSTRIIMSTNPSLYPVDTVFTQVFPHRQRYQSLSASSSSSSQKSGFPTSIRTSPPQLGFSTEVLNQGSEIRAAKSLIEGEAELSNWDSELKSDSFKKTRSYRESDEGGNDWRSSDRGERGRGRGRGGRGLAVKRRESDSDGYNGGYGNEGRGGGNRGSFGGNLRGRGRFGGEFRSRDEEFASRRENGFENSRGKGWFGGEFRSRDEEFVPRKENRFEDSRGRGRSGGEFRSRDEGFDSRRENGFENRRGGRGPGVSRGSGPGRFGGEVDRRNDGFSRNSNRGRGSWGSFDSFPKGKERFVRDRESEDDRFLSQRSDDGFRGSGSGSGSGRGGRGGRGGGGVRTADKSMGRASLMISDEDNVDYEEGEENFMHNYRELISEDEDDSHGAENDEGIEDDGVLGKGLSMAGLDINDGTPSLLRSSVDGNESYLSETRFDQCSVSPLSLKAIKDSGYEKMTIVQEATLPVILKGKDVLAKARTGTGKTVAFLLPSIELVVNSSPAGRDQKWPPILVLVVCPTRELASQAAMEASKLVKYHPSVGVQVVFGGTRVGQEQKRMQANPCQILVGTPGRLRDHIENTPGFAARISGVKVLVLDEADHLLDMGFRKDIEKIIAAIPKQRQTLLFSATVPPEVRQICHIALKRDHEYINTVEEGSEETHTQVQQTHLIAPLDKHFSVLYTLLKDHIADDVDYKVLVFCTTAMVTKLVAGLLGELKLNVREIHSRKPQSYRTRVSDEFRRSKGIILVTSDVSARGVDYPDVTLVIQVGVPADKAQYIHRLGRTGRKGKEGRGVLLLAPWEEFFLSTIRDLPISKAELPLVDPDTKNKVEKALSYVEMKNKEMAYQAWLGYYNSNKTVGRDKRGLVELANEFSRSMGLHQPPALSKMVLGKMGLKNVPGLRFK